jgi:hypothetical protein
MFIKKLDTLIKTGRNTEAAIGILGAYLGMRKEEIISLRKQNFKIFKNNLKQSYVYFLGKGAKWRQVSLSYIPNIRHIMFLITMVLSDDGQDTLLKIKNEDAFDNIFSSSDSWGKLFPCGSHDMRRTFATWNHQKGVPVLQIALALGHEELKNMDHYNQDRFRDYNQLVLSDSYLLPEYICEDEAARFALTTKRTLKDEIILDDPTKNGSFLYRVGEIDVNRFKREHKNQYKLINDILSKYSINLNDDISVTPERLKDVFNELISIPNLVQLLADGKGDVKSGVADTETIVANKQKMAEIYPHSLEMSPKKYNPKAKKRIGGKEVFYNTRYLVLCLKRLLLRKYDERKDDINYKGFYIVKNEKLKNDNSLDITDVRKQQMKLRLNSNSSAHTNISTFTF